MRPPALDTVSGMKQPQQIHCLNEWEEASSSWGSDHWTLTKSADPLHISRTRSVVTVFLLHGGAQKARMKGWQCGPRVLSRLLVLSLFFHLVGLRKSFTVKTQRCKNCKDWLNLSWDQHLEHRGIVTLEETQTRANKDETVSFTNYEK